MPLLLTAFGPFGQLEVNPSELVLEQLERSGGLPGDVVTARLPTEFAASEAKLRALIEELSPEAIVLLGVAAGAGGVRLERVARNLDDSEAPDQAGDAPSRRRIAEEGPASYASTLPLEAMREALQRESIAVELSEDAGSYVCNHAFYVARHELERRGEARPCGLIHLPLTEEVAPAAGVPRLSVATEAAAVLCCLETIARHP